MKIEDDVLIGTFCNAYKGIARFCNNQANSLNNLCECDLPEKVGFEIETSDKKYQMKLIIEEVEK